MNINKGFYRLYMTALCIGMFIAFTTWMRCLGGYFSGYYSNYELFDIAMKSFFLFPGICFLMVAPFHLMFLSVAWIIQGFRIDKN